jgi:hypothetical protein
MNMNKLRKFVVVVLGVATGALSISAAYMGTSMNAMAAGHN